MTTIAVIARKTEISFLPTKQSQRLRLLRRNSTQNQILLAMTNGKVPEPKARAKL